MKRFFGYILLIYFFASACNPTRKLKENEFLLTKNVVIDKNTTIDKSEFQNYIKQKPNRKVMGIFRFHLFINNLVDKDRVKFKKLKRDKKIDEENVLRIKRGKKPKSKDFLTLREGLLEIGEPPVILDSFLINKSCKQIKLFLENKGYFNNSVVDSVVLRRKKAKVYYKIETGKPYIIRDVYFDISDPLLSYYVLADTSNCLVRRGNNYDVDILEKEQNRITKELRNNGYFNFTKDYVYYRIDSSLNSTQVDIVIRIKNFSVPMMGTDSILEVPHTRFYINSILIQTDYAPKSSNAVSDTTRLNDYTFLSSGKSEYRPKVLADAVSFTVGELYQTKKAEATYKRLSELKAFKFINISFTPKLAYTDKLDCFIRLTPVLKQSFSVETEGTYTGGNLGIAGSVVYQNRNVFHGAEILELKFKGALEGQKLVQEIPDSPEELVRLNTFEIGPTASFTVPRFLVPFPIGKVSKNSNPKTVFRSALNYQKRLDYTRSITNASFGYNWKESQAKLHILNPLEVSYVQVDLKPDFEQKLIVRNDQFLLNSYSDHLVFGSSYSFIFNNQDIKKNKNFSYFRINCDAAGNVLRVTNRFLNPPDSAEHSYEVFGIKFSQFVRLDLDYRFYKALKENNRLVFRVAAGVGKPLHNNRTLPFEKSFFSGGPNGVRAWKARKLGPGGYVYPGSENEKNDQIGDAMFESNIEYRFNIIKILNGTFFVDAGNMWLRKPYTAYPGGDFKIKTFLSEIAIGAGTGARLDFGFFIIRFDVAVPLKDPVFPQGERWRINTNFWSRANLNFGIGYPF